jgi:hypothetical protein
LTEVESTITYEVWQERTAKFSLPPNFADHYAAGQEWLATQPDIPEQYACEVALYEQVRTIAGR